MCVLINCSSWIFYFGGVLSLGWLARMEKVEGEGWPSYFHWVPFPIPLRITRKWANSRKYAVNDAFTNISPLKLRRFLAKSHFNM